MWKRAQSGKLDEARNRRSELLNYLLDNKNNLRKYLIILICIVYRVSTERALINLTALETMLNLRMYSSRYVGSFLHYVRKRWRSSQLKCIGHSWHTEWRRFLLLTDIIKYRYNKVLKFIPLLGYFCFIFIIYLVKMQINLHVIYILCFLSVLGDFKIHMYVNFSKKYSRGKRKIRRLPFANIVKAHVNSRSITYC